MNKEFWNSIAGNEYAIPEEYNLEDLTEIVFSYLGSVDPELRDGIAYSVYANWLEQQLYSREEISGHIEKLLSNLEKGIGEIESDTVFLRAFSVLLLAEIVYSDNRRPFLERSQVERIFEKGIWYLGAEKDPRGHVPVKGWAHALAHTADLMLEIARNRHIDAANLWSILATISTVVVHSTNHVYIHGEDERLANAVLEVLQRDAISLNQLEAWAKSFSRPDGKDWKGVYVDEVRNRAYQNTRNLLRSIYLGVVSHQEKVPESELIAKLFFNTLNDIKPY